MLLTSFQRELIEAGCDEAGRGCLAGPVCAAAVILKADAVIPELNDSKKLTEVQRNKLRPIIEGEALAWAVAFVDHRQIDKINILNASILAMHQALHQLSVQPQFIAVDGNRFKPFGLVPHQTIVKGDGKYLNIAAASVLAKTHRDALMEELHMEYPDYNWKQNKGYPTAQHRKVIDLHGFSSHHRKSFKIKSLQTSIW